MDVSRKILSNLTAYLKYSRFIPELSRRETWKETVTRNKEMHQLCYPALADEIEAAFGLVYDKKVLPSMRGLQFAGKPILRNPVRQYNCCYTPVDSVDVFSEIMFLLLSGTGVGFSVQDFHVSKLPRLMMPVGERRFLVGDSLEGWADAVKVLLEAYFYGKSKPRFDFQDIRAKGSLLKTSGGIAPGPEPLANCLEKVERLLQTKAIGSRLSPIEAHDVICYISEAVLSGGIRRAALISLFSLDNEEMFNAKSNDWYETNLQRAYANNSAVILRYKIKEHDFYDLWKKVHANKSGEPAIFLSNDYMMGANPCIEAALKPYSFCNLTEINAANVHDQEDLNERARTAAFIGTLQAGYTDFHYLREQWKLQTEKDSLIGVGLTGIASGHLLDLDLRQAAAVVLAENERVAQILGIRPAARSTLVKPSGTASLVLGCSSGIHAWHSDYYIRRLKINKNEPIYPYLQQQLPTLIEDDVTAPAIQAVLSVPQKAPQNAITRDDESPIDLLNRVKRVYSDWVMPGHRRGHNTHTISCTASIKPDEWKAAVDWMWDNKYYYSAISVLPYSDHCYVQAPFEQISKHQYTTMLADLRELDTTQIVENKDIYKRVEEPACAGGVCEV